MSLAEQYLLERGITESTIAALSFELDPAPSVQSINDRLHRKDGERLVPHMVWLLETPRGIRALCTATPAESSR